MFNQLKLWKATRNMLGASSSVYDKGAMTMGRTEYKQSQEIKFYQSKGASFVLKDINYLCLASQSSQ